MPLHDAQKRWRAERREQRENQTFGFVLISAGAVLMAGLCGYVSPVEHYCGTLMAVTLGMIIALRLAGGYRMQLPLMVAAFMLAFVYFEVSEDPFALIPLAAKRKYWIFGIAAAVGATIWAFHTIGHHPRDPGAGERRETANFGAALACALLWIPAAHYIPRHY